MWKFYLDEGWPNFILILNHRKGLSLDFIPIWYLSSRYKSNISLSLALVQWWDYILVTLFKLKMMLIINFKRVFWIFKFKELLYLWLCFHYSWNDHLPRDCPPCNYLLVLSYHAPRYGLAFITFTSLSNTN